MAARRFLPGRRHDACHATGPRRLEGGERGGQVGRMLQRAAQHPGILERHVRPLREERQRGMRRIAEDRGTGAIVPAWRHAVAEEPPYMHRLRPRQQRAHLGREVVEGFAQRLGVVAVAPALGHPGVAFLRGDHVHHPPGTQRIGHKMPPRPHPDPRHRRRRLEGFERHQRAPGHLTGEEGLPGAVEPRAQPGTDALGPDHQIGLGQRPLGKVERRGKADLHPRRLGGLGEQRDQIGAVEEEPGMRVGMPLPCEVERDERRAAAIVVEPHALGLQRPRRHARLAAQRRQHRRAVRRDLDARAHLGDSLGTLVQHHPRACLRQRRRRGEPGDAAPRHRHIETGNLHPCLPERKHRGAAAPVPVCHILPDMCRAQSSRWTFSRRS